MASRSRSRSRNKWLPLSPTEQQARAASKGTPLLQPWREHPSLVAVRDRLQLAYDCWNLLQSPEGACRRSVYLPQGHKEPSLSYGSRIEAARPTGFFRDALRTYAGMLSFLHPRALPSSLLRVLGDVDGHGTDLSVFLFVADLLVLRDGGCLLMVLPPEHRWPSEGHRLDAIAAGDRASLPRLLLVPRTDLLDWAQPNPQAAPHGLWWRQDRRRPVTPRQHGAIPVHFIGADGNQLQSAQLSDWTYHRLLLTPDGMTQASFAAVPSPREPGGFRAQPLGTALLSPRLHQLPAVWYAADGAGFGQGDLPHLGLAHQYLTHYRLKSEYEDLLSRCALPVAVRSGLVDQFGNVPDANGDERPAEPLVLSTNTFMDLPAGADFEWKEIRARSLAEHRAYLQMLDQNMRRDALVPAENMGAGRSEQEISLTAGQSFALLQSLATHKTSVFSTLLGHWCALTGDPLEAGAGVSLTVTPLTPPARPLPSVDEWLSLHERGVISSAELRHQLALSSAPGVVNPMAATADPIAVPSHQP